MLVKVLAQRRPWRLAEPEEQMVAKVLNLLDHEMRMAESDFEELMREMRRAGIGEEELKERGLYPYFRMIAEDFMLYNRAYDRRASAIEMFEWWAYPEEMEVPKGRVRGM